jgi:hypothetical protein
MTTRVLGLRPITFTLATLVLCACGSKPSETESAAPPAAPTAPPVAPAAQPTPPPTPPPAALPDVPPGAKVAFIEPADGAKIEGPLENGKVSVQVKMSADSILVKPAGAVEAGSGHHHILIDAEPVAAGMPVPKDDQHLHFGKGQTEAIVPLTPGEHVLSLQFADGIHRSYGSALSASIKVTAVAAGTLPASATKPGATPAPAAAAAPAAKAP